MAKGNSAAQLAESQKNREQQERFFQTSQAETRRQFEATQAFQTKQSADMRQLSRVSPNGTPTAVDAAKAAGEMGRMLQARKGFDKYRFA